MKESVKEFLKYFIISLITILVITFGWQGLELLFYGEIQQRVIDDIISIILFVSIMINAILIDYVFYKSTENCVDEEVEETECIDDNIEESVKPEKEDA